MFTKDLARSRHTPAGYAALIERYGVDVVPNWHISLVAEGGSRRLTSHDGVVEETYPSSYWPGETACDHLEFALKYDGTNLALLYILFRTIEEKDILEHIRSRPTGKYARRLWFFYEFLTGRGLPLEDLKQGNYIDLLEPEKYYTRLPSERVRRQRVNNNLPGGVHFCPLVRRTEALVGYEKANLAERCRRTVAAYPSELLLRAAEKEDFCRKSGLIELQNRITDPRFHASDYRSEQNYVGETVVWQGERIHFVGPKPEDLPDLMNGLTAKKTVREIVDMPDRQIDLFIRFCLQNNGRLSGRKRADHFDFLSDHEVAALEEAVQTSFGRNA
ncbi:MAG: hypothetical protein WCY56_06140 [Aminobacteriaceae bacterium]